MHKMRRGFALRAVRQMLSAPPSFHLSADLAALHIPRRERSFAKEYFDFPGVFLGDFRVQQVIYW